VYLKTFAKLQNSPEQTRDEQEDLLADDRVTQ
jgi:hypothetical protein